MHYSNLTNFLFVLFSLDFIYLLLLLLLLPLLLLLLLPPLHTTISSSKLLDGMDLITSELELIKKEASKTLCSKCKEACDETASTTEGKFVKEGKEEENTTKPSKITSGKEHIVVEKPLIYWLNQLEVALKGIY